MSALARWCHRRRRVVLGSWIAVLVGLAVAVLATGTDFRTATQLPDSESSTAYRLLAEAGAGTEGVSQGAIVWRTDGEAIDAPSVRAEVSAMLDEVAALPGV
ncbi:MAG TPA: hypothetical protein VGK35_14815, partial [Actinotalea sp.]